MTLDVPSSPRHALARRIGAVLVGAALFAPACGGDDGTSSASATAGTTTGSFPVTVAHHLGEVTIPEAPERVVSLGYTEQDAILAFDVVPVAVRYAFGPEDDVFFPWADGAAGDAEPEIMARAEINVEQIAALDPDLIMAVTAGLDEEEYELLSAIAPTVVQPEGFPDFGTPWQEQTRITGLALGQPDRADELVAEVEAAFEEARTAHPDLDGTSLVLSGPTYDGEYPFHASADTRTRFFLDLGMEVPEPLDEIAGDHFYGTVSRERVELLDTDVVVWQAGSDEERAAIAADPVLATLPAVADGRTVFVEGDEYAALSRSERRGPGRRGRPAGR